MRIFLVGFMGCGKTSAGKKLAGRLGLHFIDLDNYIEEKTGKTIAEIFATNGEKNFRNYEHDSVSEISLKNNVLVATGGGTPCFYNNLEIINRSGLSIYLKMDAISLANRLINSKTERPLIKGKSKSELISYIKETLKEREKFYQKSNIIVPGLNPDINKILTKIDEYTR